jgi:hypothetical protein
MQYLYEEQYYIDRYDLSTIKACLDVVKMFQEVYDKSLTAEEMKSIPKHEKYKGAYQMCYWHLVMIKAQEYKKKNETIQKWMETDKVEQEKYDLTPAPSTYCSDCKVRMKSTMKHLENYMDESLRVLFFFECPTCKKRKGVYEDGEERVSKPDLCPKCNKEAKVTHTRKGDILTWKTTCSACGFKEKTVDDFAKMKEEREKREQEEKDLLQKHRKEFCLSDEEGKKHIEIMGAMEYANEAFEEEKQKYDHTSYQQAIQVKKLSIVELEKLLSELLEKSKYIKLSFDKPEIGQFVIVPFTVQDADASRKKDTSSFDLQKLIKDTLEGTNWRLVNNDTIYRLGYLSGNLKGYEHEEDLIKLYGKKEQKPKEDKFEKERQYGSNNWVQIARITGKHAGIEAMRKRRLEKEPEGFFLEENRDGYYTCFICRDSYYGNEIWWNLDGLRCKDCWRNTKEGVIPRLSSDKDDMWVHKWQLERNHGVRASSAKKLRKEGLLHGRDLKREDGSIYCTVYLNEENQEFLKKYPKKADNIKMTMLDMNGHIVEF